MAETVQLGKLMEATKQPPGRGCVFPWWAIVCCRHGNRLGDVRYHPGWRQYVFEPRGITQFSYDCLDEMRRFLLRLNAERKRRARGDYQDGDHR